MKICPKYFKNEENLMTHGVRQLIPKTDIDGKFSSGWNTSNSRNSYCSFQEF